MLLQLAGCCPRTGRKGKGKSGAVLMADSRTDMTGRRKEIIENGADERLAD